MQTIATIPEDLRELYKTVWEVPLKVQMQMAADRGAFIDQSQSFNIHVAQPNYAKMSSIHFHGWRLGLKTGMYYLRTKPAAESIQFTVDKTRLPEALAAAAAEKISAGHGAASRSASRTVTPSASAEQTPATTPNKAQIRAEDERNMADLVCSLSNKEECMSCGS